jgi:DNA integrity scanning protein DisA with diadenylate cyclase activity
MSHPLHEAVVDLIQKAVALMDGLLRYRIDLDEYSEKLRALDVDSVMVAHERDFKNDAKLVYYLDALMLLSSLQHELDFQVAEYGANVALEDMQTLQELLEKFPEK